MRQPMKLIAKTNRIGLFQNQNKESIVLNKKGMHQQFEEFNLHVDSSHRSCDVNIVTGAHIYTTGFVMKSANEQSHGYASGGSIRYHEDRYGSHIFELEGIIDTLRTVADYFRDHRYPIKLNVFTDNITVVNAYDHWVYNVSSNNTQTQATLRKIIEADKELFKQFNVSLNWEKGHSSKNIANRFADSIARGIRHEGARHNNLSPLQMCGILSRVSRKGNQGVYERLLNDYMLRLFTELEKSAVLQINSSVEGYFSYKLYYHGKANQNFTRVRAENIYKAMNLAIEELRRKVEWSGEIPRLYLVGSGFDGVEMFVRDYQRTALLDTKSQLEKFYSNADITFSQMTLLGGCCENTTKGHKVLKKHNEFIKSSQQWEEYKLFMRQHYSVWDQFNLLRYLNK